MDYQNTLKSLLSTMRQTAANQFCAMLREIADSIEAESEPLETMQEDSIMVEFNAVWFDR